MWRLEEKEQEELKQMAINGVAPEDIATHFGISISSVHNYKSRFKQAGVNFPSVRGSRPKGYVEGFEQETLPEASGIKFVTKGSVHKFVVNGTPIQITGKAKSISIDADSTIRVSI